MNSFLLQSSTSLKRTSEMDLSDCTEKLLRTPTSINKWIEIADKHMQTKKADPDMYALPRAHEFLSPVIDALNNIEEFLDYIIMLRDNFSKGDKTWEDIQKVFRKINGRHVQAVRRDRASRACAKAQELYGETDYHSRIQWVSDLEHKWAGRRLEFLDGSRAKFKSDRLDTETRKDALLEFWNTIDTEIYEGRNIPPWN